MTSLQELPHMRRILSLAALSILALSASASAQRSGSYGNPSPEIGMDAGLIFGLSSPSTTTFQLPLQQIRLLPVARAVD